MAAVNERGSGTMPAKKDAKRKSSNGFTAEERAAMKERARELKAQARGAAGERDVLEKIAAMPPGDRALAKKVHALVTKTAPALTPRTWYGMPAYAAEDGKVVCFFTPASKFKQRYSTFGFNAVANLDEGDMWPTSFALKKLGAVEEKKLAALVKKAVR
jgi:uncharacterized protein YdhG (YjbR/CyaY superfamily)